MNKAIKNNFIAYARPIFSAILMLIFFSVMLDFMGVFKTAYVNSDGLSRKIEPRQILNIKQAYFTMLGSFYLLCLTWIDGMASVKRLHYTLLVLLVYIFSFALIPPILVPSIIPSHQGNGLLSTTMVGLATMLLSFSFLFLQPLRDFYASLGRGLMRIDALPPRVVVGIMALCFMLLAAFFSQRWFGHLPHVLDSHTMYMHSKMMASGYLCMPPDPNPDFFSVFDTYTQNGYCSASFPGHVFLLTIGQLLQVPWIVNPFMGALLLVAVFILGREIDGRQTGYIAAGLTMLSPFIVAMASEFMNSITTGFCLILFLWSYIRLLKTWRPKYAVIAGVLVGYSFLTRVQATVPFALPMGLHALYMLYKSPRERFKPIVLMALLFASSVAMLCAYNYRVTGDPFITAYQVSDNSSLSMYIMKFAHWSAWENIYNDFARATAQYNQLHTGIFGWQTSSLVFAMLLLLTRQQPPYSGLLTCCVVSQYLGLVFVHGMHGSVFEPRYVFESAPIYILWTAAWFRRMPAMAGILIRKAHGFTREQYIGASAGVLIVLSACALPHKVADLYAKYIDNYWQGNLPYLRAIMRRAQHPSLVFLGPEKAFEYTVFMQPAQDTDRIIFVRDTGDNYWKMMERYPDRYYYRVENKMMKEIVCDVEHSPYEKY